MIITWSVDLIGDHVGQESNEWKQMFQKIIIKTNNFQAVNPQLKLHTYTYIIFI